MKKHILFGLFLGMALVYVAFAQNGHERVTVETSPFARQLLTNDTAVAWASIIGINTNGGSLPALAPAQIFIGGASSNALAQTITGDISLAQNGLAVASANFPRLTFTNVFTGPVTLNNSASTAASGFTIVNGGGPSQFNLSGSSGTVTLTAGLGNLTISSPVSSSQFIGAFIGNGQLINSIQAPLALTGLVPPANLGTGTANSTTFLRGDQTYAVVSAGIPSLNGSATNLNVLNITTSGTSTFGGTNVFTNAVGNGGGFTNLQATNLVGAPNYAWFGMAMLPRRYAPPQSTFADNWGSAQVFSADGTNWIGASGFPTLSSTTNVVRDPDNFQWHGNYYCAPTSTAAVDGTARDYVQLYESTNKGASYFLLTNIVFTNGSLAQPDETFAPIFFVSNGVPCMMAAINDDVGVKDFRIVQAIDTNSLTNWSACVELNGTQPSGSAVYPFDDTAISGNWYLLDGGFGSGVNIWRGKNPIGPYTNLTTLFSSGCEDPSMFRLPNGRLRIYTDRVASGYMMFGESLSGSVEGSWGNITNVIVKQYFGSFIPMMITNLQDIATAHEAASDSCNANWSPFVDSPNFSSSSDYPHLDFGLRSSEIGLPSATPPMAFGYRFAEGFEFNVTNQLDALIIGENGLVSAAGVVAATNGFASYSTVVNTIVWTGTGITNTSTTNNYEGYLTCTQPWTNLNGALTAWSTNVAGTNIMFKLKPGAAIRAPSGFTVVGAQGS